MGFKERIVYWGSKYNNIKQANKQARKDDEKGQKCEPAPGNKVHERYEKKWRRRTRNEKSHRQRLIGTISCFTHDPATTKSRNGVKETKKSSLEILQLILSKWDELCRRVFSDWLCECQWFGTSVTLIQPMATFTSCLFVAAEPCLFFIWY